MLPLIHTAEAAFWPLLPRTAQQWGTEGDSLWFCCRWTGTSSSC